VAHTIVFCGLFGCAPAQMQTTKDDCLLHLSAGESRWDSAQNQVHRQFRRLSILPGILTILGVGPTGGVYGFVHGALRGCRAIFEMLMEMSVLLPLFLIADGGGLRMCGVEICLFCAF